MKKVSYLLSFALIFLPTSVVFCQNFDYQKCVNEALNDTDMAYCENEAYKASDLSLNYNYQKLKAQCQSYEGAAAKDCLKDLANMQIAWIEMKEQTALFVVKYGKNAGSTRSLVDEARFNKEETQKRALVLEQIATR